MRYKKHINLRKKRGFTIIESLAYIFMTTIILMEGINLFVLMYKSYLEAASLTVKYNNFQNFYINFDNIICEGGLDEAIVDDKSILFSKIIEDPNLYKTIKSYNGEIVVKCINKEGYKSINTMLEHIDNFEVKRKGRLIYLIIHDKDGKEFIRCI